ncbi:hypothetical protein V5O48_006693 [Marasmius crinis-equi]|uniref:Abscisic acid G-protein coupled receptor-domain-containing protein n=1 Tax=Marasmius crinis-equi TaxID=585013 RepID=A0ABR3FJD1_9AGAR
MGLRPSPGYSLPSHVRVHPTRKKRAPQRLPPINPRPIASWPHLSRLFDGIQRFVGGDVMCLGASYAIPIASSLANGRRDGIGVFKASTRLTDWKFSISFLLIPVLILTPIFVSLVISLGTGFTRVFINFLPLLSYLYFPSLIPVPSGLSNNDLFTVTLAWLVVVGTIILGLLSGVGAVAVLEEYFGVFRRGRSQPTLREIESAERALMTAREDLRARTEEATRRASDSPFTGGDDLALELKDLQALESEMSLNLEDLRSRYARVEFASTFRGRILTVCGKVFAGYCVIGIISAIINLTIPHFLLTTKTRPNPTSTPSTNYPDLITKVIGDLLALTSANVDVETVGSVMRQISLVLVGVIVGNSLRVVLRAVTTALRVTSKSLSASLMLLILAQLMGIYLLSTVVQLRSAFPQSQSEEGEDDTNLFSTIPEFQVFGKLFDGSFLLTAACSAGFRWFRERVTGDGDS